MRTSRGQRWTVLLRSFCRPHDVNTNPKHTGKAQQWKGATRVYTCSTLGGGLETGKRTGEHVGSSLQELGSSRNISKVHHVQTRDFLVTGGKTVDPTPESLVFSIVTQNSTRPGSTIP